MQDSHPAELLKASNQSGFPFQLGVRKRVEHALSLHGWRIVAEEHHWQQSGGRTGGFIDLIAEHERFLYSLVIECKRVRAKPPAAHPSWIFLTPGDNATTQSRLSGFMTEKLDNMPDGSGTASAPLIKSGWTDTIEFNPATLESSYCVFDSQDEKSPAIERIADTLLPSVESAGLEWLTFGDVSSHERRLFLPIIVTNATLYTCTFEAGKVSMLDGGLPDANWEEVPLVRFRKGLVMEPSHKGTARNFADANRRQQRTLLIANSAALPDILTQLDLTASANRSFVTGFQRLNPRPASAA